MSIQADSIRMESRKDFERNGFLLVRGLFSQEEVRSIREAFMEQGANGPVPGLSDARPSADPKDPLSFYPRMMHPHRHPELPIGPLSMRYLLDSRIEAVLSDLFGEEPIAAQSMFYFKPPGARGQDLHQDNFYLRVKPGTCMAMWLAVDDADQANGGLVVVPQTGDLEIACPEKADSSKFFTTDHVSAPEGLEPVPADMKAGDVLFFNGSVIHGSYPNDSEDRFRRAFICHYVPASSAEVSRWYRPLYRFNGEEVLIDDATGGGPCGTVETVTTTH
jgi:ectoine hydroxylase-related dioxygenase (phytanoyl-CoA dioxygenase family)